jgi:hypothetical protein
MFFSRFFQTPPQNFYTAETLEMDIMRDDEFVAIAVPSIDSTGRENENTVYSNKGYTAPIFKEVGTVNSYDLIRRIPGVNPFQDPDYAANAALESFRIFRKLENKVRRATELMAAQVLTTAAINCVDPNNNSITQITFPSKSTHFVTVSNLWSGGSANPLSDLASMAVTIRTDGRQMPVRAVFGFTAWQLFIKDATVQTQLNRFGLQLGALSPQQMTGVDDRGATFQGYFNIGNYRLEAWTYDGWYLDPVTKTHIRYLPDNKVIILSDGGRLDMTYGQLPILRRPENAALQFLPPRISSPEKGVDMTVNAWFTENGEHLKVSCGTRALPIPTAIDTFGCLTVA